MIPVILFWKKYSSPDPCLEPIHNASGLSTFTFKPEHYEKVLKNDKYITGVQIENSEFLLSQYADDSSLILEKSLHVLSLFS
jgi:hypothetical protein